MHYRIQIAFRYALVVTLSALLFASPANGALTLPAQNVSLAEVIQ
jgi:hypothetical protein